MSNYIYSNLALDDLSGPDTPSHSITRHQASENVAGGGQFSQSYYRYSSSLASALTPAVSKVEGKRAHMWSQTSSDKSDSQIHSPGSPLNNRGWYAEHCVRDQAVYESATVMPERHMFGWSSVNSLQGACDSNHSLLDNEKGRRRALTLAPQDMDQFPQQQRQTSISKLRDSLYARPGIPSHTPASKPLVSPTNHQQPLSYHTEPSLDHLYSKETSTGDVQSSTASIYLASSGYSVAEELTVVAEKPYLSPEFLYVNVDNLEDEPTIRCPYKWCKSTFTRSNDLARHLATASMHRERVHVDPSKRCRLCGEEFSRSDARNRHEIKRSCGKKRTRRAAAV